MDKARISIIGAGYVGLVTAVCLASRGHEVIVSTHSSKKAGLISRGIAPFYEKGLDPLLRDAVRSGGLRVVIGRERAVLGSDVSFITVATPSKPDGSIDLRFIEATSRDIGLALAKKPGYHLVVVKSTVIPGTTQDVVGPLVESASGKRAGPDFGLCMNPEFLKEGAAVHDTLHPDRIVIGELDRRSGDLLESLYREFYGDDVPPVMRTNIPTAEMIKYVNNSFLAMKVSFINQIANICERVPGVDVKDVARGIGLDYRINPRFLRAGPGFGGSCFPKDVSALISFAESKGYEPSLLREVLSVNARQARHVVDLLMDKLGELRGKRVAILGLSFKPGTDDMREAPSIRVIEGLLDEGATVVAYDPIATESARRAIGDRITYAPSVEDCLRGADGCVIVTEWDEFATIGPETFLELMKTPVLVDSRRVYDPRDYSKKLDYTAIGRGP